MLASTARARSLGRGSGADQPFGRGARHLAGHVAQAGERCGARLLDARFRLRRPGGEVGVKLRAQRLRFRRELGLGLGEDAVDLGARFCERRRIGLERVLGLVSRALSASARSPLILASRASMTRLIRGRPTDHMITMSAMKVTTSQKIWGA